MKTIKIFILLVLFSFQAGASGYSHNMFVAHKKLQSGKECSSPNERIIAKKAKASKFHAKLPAATIKQQTIASSFSSVSDQITLNDRILEAGPASFFIEEEKENYDQTFVSRLVAMIRSTICTFVGSSKLANS
ncbi:hypothetical protein FEM33_05450 [Dyadobacter flavalbus]|uniref:Uncharacterized protein n=1 Tax=Dyadobacter flavalbus TaxID=2579942 RepID=A0A5M8QYC9_9BACT|nr:hypothetical protein [Dyadobacter flavalbus]KAA6440050.1 hypothetical protein FEM33_05450 [Dyadobacter flavalbus]